MEIDFHNTLPLVVKITLLPCRTIYGNFLKLSIDAICVVLDLMLTKPPLSMLIFTTIMSILLTLLAFSYLVTIAVACVVLSLIAFEAFVLTTMLVEVILTIMLMILMTSIFIYLKQMASSSASVKAVITTVINLLPN